MLDILNEIESDNSRLHKIAVLTKNKNDVLLKETFRLAYDPFTQFYIRKIPEYTPAKPEKADLLINAFENLKALSSRTFTGHAGIAHLHSILSSLNESDAQVIERIIGKDLKCGASDSSANKVWKDLIPEFAVMLCSTYDEKLIKKMSWPALGQKKEDGLRCVAIVDPVTNSVEFKTRNGRDITLHGNLGVELLASTKEKTVYDGELLFFDEDEYQFLDRKTGNGLGNKAVKGTISIKEASQACFVLWDVIRYEDFVIGKSNIKYETRFRNLETITTSNKLRVVQSKVVANIDEARELFQSYLAEGAEGIILKDLQGIWENKRSKHQIKFKAELVKEMMIVSIQEGAGKYTGMVGALQCESSDGVIKVGVGTGLNDQDRIELMNSVGKIVSVKYNEKIKNTKGEYSLFLPVFDGVRLDKTEADHSRDF